MRALAMVCSLALLTLAGSGSRVDAQDAPAPVAQQQQAPAPTAAQPPAATRTAATRTAADSACVTPSFPFTGSFIFAGLREAIADARGLASSPPLPPGQATLRALKLTLGWSAVLILLGLGVLVFAPEKLRRITDTLGEDPMTALLTGLVVDLATIPALIVLLILLTVTLLGILLIPFAIVAFLLMWMGVAALGFFAVAQVTGMAAMGPKQRTMSQRGAALGGLITGLVMFLLPWLAASAMTWSSTPALVLRGIAIAVTAVAVTTGLGAVVRAHKPARAGENIPPAARAREELAWQTPTPVGGVVAAKRPAKAH